MKDQYELARGRAFQTEEEVCAKLEMQVSVFGTHCWVTKVTVLERCVENK